MSEEQKVSFMQELDRWSDEMVIQPLLAAVKKSRNGELSEEARYELEEEAMQGVRTVIRQKVLQSYRNGRMTRGEAPANLPVARRPVRA